uniref:LIM zinc-binding domain-containing protein n=1 Tax=Panagrolaimus sp. PS1159 TaxID=55785 RepID=A0AC35GUP5_9BILA
MSGINLLPLTLSNSDLYNRRTSSLKRQDPTVQNYCTYCLEEFVKDEEYIHAESYFFHKNCFNCAQCFMPLMTGSFFNIEGRFYCEYDFAKNYAPLCRICKKYVLGRVIKTVKGHYHPKCLTCDDCGDVIENQLYFDMMKNLCQNCHKTTKKPDMCVKCKIPVLEEERLWYRNDCWHAYHFECTKCATQLDNKAQIWRERLYCQRCYDRYVLKTCAQCHKTIEYQEERAIMANGKYYHPGEAGDQCTICQEAKPEMISALKKFYCEKCFLCAHCNKALELKSSMVNFDEQPICKKCFEHLPKELRKRLKVAAKSPKLF